MKSFLTAILFAAVFALAPEASAGGSSYEGFYKFYEYKAGDHDKGDRKGHRHHKKTVEYVHPGPIVGGPYPGIPDNPCHSDCGSEPEVDHTHDIGVADDNDGGRHGRGHGHGRGGDEGGGSGGHGL